MFHPTLSKSGRFFFGPLIKLCEFLGNHFPALLLKMRYYYVFRKQLDLKNPKDLNEKILWAKLYSDTSKWTELADKYRVRNYVSQLEWGVKCLLPELYGVWYNSRDIKFESLPETFILKANNGDGKGTNKIVRKSELTDDKRKELLNTVDEWLHRKNIGALHAEPQYKGMKPCVIAEELLPCEPGTSTLTDYKIWCFNGKACYIWVCNDRSKGGNSAHVMTYDLDWNPHPEFSIFNSDYLKGDIIPKPQNLADMITIAEKLSEGFPELRVDLYNVQGKIYFGELTFTSQGGFMDFYTPEFNLELGNKFDIKDFPLKKEMTNKDLVSIIMPTYKCGRFIEESIKSVQAQTYQNWELIIVDDCSGDETIDVVLDIKKTDDRISLYQNAFNSGAAVSRNTALRNAKGRWIAFLDSDDLWEPTKLERQIKFMEENGYAFSYHEYVEIDEQDKELGVHVSGKKHVSKFDMFACCWPGCLSVMYDAQKIGLIQINDIKKNNDTAMWLKVIRKADCYLLPECLGKYRRRANSITPKPLWQRIWAHYPLFRVAEEMNPIAATFWVIMNVFGNAYKKMFFVKKYVV